MGLVRRFLLASAAAVLCAACSSSSQGTPQEAGHLISGTVVVPGNFKNGYVGANRQSDCLVAESATDIRQGQQVQLVDETGSLVAVANLEFGSPATIGESVPFECSFRYSFSGVPDAKFYTVRIGLHEAPAMSAGDLSAAGWSYNPIVVR
jgi:hypothetical protein